MINLSATYQCKTIEEFLQLVELAKENRSIQTIASAPRLPVKGEKGQYEKAWLEYSGNAFVRLTSSVKEFMQSKGMDLEAYCKYRLENNGGETNEELRDIPEESEIDLDNVV